jgi:osmoprotectant transport system substrate-binding protein
MRRRTTFPRSLVLAAAGVALTLGLSACGDDNALDETPEAGTSGSPAAEGGGSVVIGSAGFTEIQLLAEMYALLLTEAGYDTEIRVVENREIYEPALETGDIDVVPDYAATMAEFLNREANGPDAPLVATNDAAETVEAMRTLAEPLGLAVLEPAEAVDQNAFVVSEEFATANSLTTLSDLGASGVAVVLAATEECPTRPFCQLGLEETYGINITSVEPLGFGSVQTKEAVSGGQAQLGLVGSTDGTLEDFGLVLLEDDKGLQLADNLVPVVGVDYADDTALADALNALAPVLTTDDLATLNTRVDADREVAADVAQSYLEEKGLLG